jgi:hypothetical protein
LLDGAGVTGLVVEAACCAIPILVRTGLMAFIMPPLEPRPNLEATVTARKWQAQHDGILRAGDIKLIMQPRFCGWKSHEMRDF